MVLNWSSKFSFKRDEIKFSSLLFFYRKVLNFNHILLY
nr:MAG TPA: hypothetical protein [Caudoviricetes sp.]